MTVRFKPLPAPGDIVWCHFPEIIGKPGPKARPALVTAVFDDDYAIRVAYGTSQKTNNLYRGEFVLDPQDAGFALSGLGARTKFDLGNLFVLPFDSDWFSANQGIYASTPLPRMGSMHPSYMLDLQKALSLLALMEN